MANFVRHTSCEHCGSKDNLAIYDDGSEWCFGCHFYKPPNIRTNNVAAPKRDSSYNIVTLPDETIPSLPKWARSWLDQYNLTEKELQALAPLYSYSKDLLIFPVYGGNNDLLCWQGRYFGSDPKHPKYLTKGHKDILHVMDLAETDADVVVVVEDSISAAKVASVIPAMPLWGSHLSADSAKRLAHRFSDLILWLDFDKSRESMKLRHRYAPLFTSVTSVFSKLDPKDYTHDEIRRLIAGL